MKFEFSAGAMIYDYADGKKEPLFLLLIKDNDEYDFAKGHIEKGESSEVAAKREIKEETGLDVEFIRGFSTVTKYFFYRKREKIIKQVRIFLAEVHGQKVKISYEHKGYEWLAYNEAYEKIKFKDMRRVLTEANDYIKRKEDMDKINKEYAKLPNSASHWDLSPRLVPGEGSLTAKVMLVGQAPGNTEDQKLRPFVGRSGMLLDRLLKSVRIRRDSVYITSVVQFFPPKNRMPTDKEIGLCIPFLRSQIELIKPRFVITLGSLSGSVLAGVDSVEKEHGRIEEKEGIRYMITFHPAAALRFKRIEELMFSDMKKFGSTIRSPQK